LAGAVQHVLVFNQAFSYLDRMLKRLWWACLFAASASAQSPSLQVEVANLREDVRGLVQRVGELSLRVEQLERENNELRGRAGTAERSYATLDRLNDAIATLNQNIRSAAASAKSETLQQVGAQMEKLAKQTNAAIDSLARGMATRAPVQTTFSDDYAKEGISYTVQKGDTLAEIAKKTGAKVQDIVNANKLADPSHINIGQTLFSPGGK
jgi:LysM repeat protein/FtsZ-binding cell division protein ZapB